MSVWLRVKLIAKSFPSPFMTLMVMAKSPKMILLGLCGPYMRQWDLHYRFLQVALELFV